MRKALGVPAALGFAVAIAIYIAGGVTAVAESPLAVNSARVAISGTSNIHPYTASTTKVRVTHVELGPGWSGPDAWAHATAPGGIKAFTIAISAETLASPREGVDQNMHKALKTEEHPDITFRLLRFEPKANAGTRAIGVLQVAGVEREVDLAITTERKGSTLSVQGQVRLLMTDFDVKPPTAMLGMLKTDPKVTVTFEMVLAIPTT